MVKLGFEKKNAKFLYNNNFWKGIEYEGERNIRINPDLVKIERKAAKRGRIKKHIESIKTTLKIRKIADNSINVNE